ncbi:MAG: NAD(P)H-binding protein [Verrucomicrobiota bacterium]|nr:NAD(P)H-binding protein [Verrucomicrobiota bacterium]
MRTLIIGCGYTGEALGERLCSIGHEVSGVRRNKANNARLIELGITPLNLDITKTTEIQQIPNNYDNVIIAVSSSRGGIETYKNVFGKGIINISNWLRTQSSIKSVIFISSTSVYRETHGEWVNEEINNPPSNSTSKTLWNAEQLVTRIASPVTILRSSGIYGPQRGYLFNQYMKGIAKIDGKGERFINMVHRNDLVESIIKSLPNPGGIYNITDDEPVTQYEFFKWLSSTTGRPMPPNTPPIDPATRKRGITNKRVSNALFKDKFGFNYIYPTFREGLTEELNKRS